MRRKIKDIAEIQIGYQFRGKIEPTSDGTCKVIQIKNFSENHSLNKEKLHSVKIPELPQKYLVNKNDVLFLARGNRNYASPIRESLERTIAASYFFILKIKMEKVLPEYLAWFINQVPAQEYLHNLARRGTHMPVVPKATFENLTIYIPDVNTQGNIVKLNSLMEKEKDLLNNIQQKKTLLIRSLCLKATKQNL